MNKWKNKIILIILGCMGMISCGLLIFRILEKSDINEKNRETMNIYYDYLIEHNGDDPEYAVLMKMLNQYIPISDDEENLISNMREIYTKLNTMEKEMNEVIPQISNCSDVYEWYIKDIQQYLDLTNHEIDEWDHLIERCKSSSNCNDFWGMNEKLDYQYLNKEGYTYSVVESYYRYIQFLKKIKEVYEKNILYSNKLKSICHIQDSEEYKHRDGMLNEVDKQQDSLIKNRNQYSLDCVKYRKKMINMEDKVKYEWMYC